MKREVGPQHLSNTFFLVIEKMIETVFLALMATTIAILVAFPISFLAARNLMSVNPISVTIYYIVRTILNVLRSVEPLIMAIIFVVWVGLGPFAGVLALAVHSIAALGKLYSEVVESIDPGPIEAVTSTGANRLQTIVYAVIPQVVPPYLAFTIYRWDINVRMSTIIGFVGGGGLGYLLQQWIRLFMYKEAGAAVWAIVIVVAIMDFASAKAREKMI
ncbi:MAG: phosphonate ABC transporter, permease protein PhnE [Candidatus Humimicrobiia bacterium]